MNEEEWKKKYMQSQYDGLPFYATGSKPKKKIDLSEPKFYENSKVVKDRGAIKTIPNPSNALLGSKKQRSTSANRIYNSLKLLSKNTEFKYVLDENCQANEHQRDIIRVINSTALCFQNGISSKNMNDAKILECAIKDDYIIVTRDKGLIFRSIQHKRPVVFIGKKDKLYFLDSVLVRDDGDP